MPVSLKQSLPFKVYDKTGRSLNISHICHVLRPAYSTSFAHPKFAIKLVLFTPVISPFALFLLSLGVSGFSRSIIEVSAVRGCCAAQVGNWLPMTGTTSVPS